MGRKHPVTSLGVSFWIAVFWVVLVVLAAATVSWWAIPPPDRMDWDHPGADPGTITRNAFIQGLDAPFPVSYTYLLGTDTLGRDIVSRLVYGARVSMAVGLLSPVIGLLIGGFLGCLAGFYRGWIESCIVSLMDVILAFPGLVILLAVTFYLGTGIGVLITCLGFLSIPAFCRVARARTMSLSHLEFVQAARLTGAGQLSILAREIIPNVIVPVSIYGLLVVAFMIMAEGSLSFLGLGIPAPVPSWGGMIADGREVLEKAPHISLIPATTMFLTVAAFNWIGDSLRSYFEHGQCQL